MKSSFKEISGSEIEVEVILDQKEFEIHWNRALEEARNTVNIKGFRPGTAPSAVADRYLNKDAVFESASNSAVRKTLNDLALEHEWTLIDTPKVELLENAKNNELGLTYKAKITIMPKVNLGEYKKIAKKILAEKKSIVVNEEEIDKSLTWISNSRASVIAVNRDSKKGDEIEIDVTTECEGKLVNGAQIKKERFTIGESQFLPGFDKQLENRKTGQDVVFQLQAPTDYWNHELRDKNLSFKIHVYGVYERSLPELNDAFAQSLGPNFKTMDDLRRNIQTGISEEKEEKEQQRLQLKILEEIASKAKIAIPEIMIEKTVANMSADYGELLKKTGKSADEIKTSLRPQAIKSIEHNLIIHSIAQQENLAPTPEEVAAATAGHGHREKIDPREAYDYSYGVLQNKKVFQFFNELSKS